MTSPGESVGISFLDNNALSYFFTHTINLSLWNPSVQAARRKIPILIDSERKREGLDELLPFATYVVCSAKFPQVIKLLKSIDSIL